MAQFERKKNRKDKSKSAESADNSGESSHSSAAKLPVRRLVLYKNGIGYFEHLGRARGSRDVQVDFTSAQLNDVLKSLTILDLSGGRITGVDYDSEAPLARRLATLRLAILERPTCPTWQVAPNAHLSSEPPSLGRSRFTLERK